MELETTKGVMDDSLLEKRQVTERAQNGTSLATEYWLNGELVRRDVFFSFHPDYQPQVVN